MVSFPNLVEALQRRDVRFVLIGIWGVNAHASDGAAIFTTNDFDLFLPPDADNLLRTWPATSSASRYDPAVNRSTRRATACWPNASWTAARSCGQPLPAASPSI